MCDSCGCTPCIASGAPIEDGLWGACGEKADDCTYEPLDEEYEDEEPEDEEDEEEEEYDDEDEDW